MTNFEKIKSMSIEEMAEFLDDYFGEMCGAVDNCGCCPFFSETGCEGSTRKWLESEVE